MTELQRASARLFGPHGIGCSDIKIFPGDGQFTAEQLAGEINKALDALQSGNYELVLEDD